MISPKTYIIMGGGVTDSLDLPSWVADRLTLLNSMLNEGDSVIFTSRYTMNVAPKIDPLGYPIIEAKLMYDDFRKCSKIKKITYYLETCSTDTIGAAVFVRLLFSDLLEGKDINVITSDFHKNRTQHIFKTIFDAKPKLDYLNIKVLASKTKVNTKKRQKREKNSLQQFKAEYDNIAEFYNIIRHLREFHDNYNIDCCSKLKTGNDENY